MEMLCSSENENEPALYKSAVVNYPYGTILNRNIRPIVTLVLLLLVSFLATFYTVAAYGVARRVYDLDGTLCWVDSGGGSFFPWPQGPDPGTGIFPVVIPMTNNVDIFIYVYLIKSWVLVAVTVLLWAGFTTYIFMLIRATFQASGKV